MNSLNRSKYESSIIFIAGGTDLSREAQSSGIYYLKISRNGKIGNGWCLSKVRLECELYGLSVVISEKKQGYYVHFIGGNVGKMHLIQPVSAIIGDRI